MFMNIFFFNFYIFDYISCFIYEEKIYQFAIGNFEQINNINLLYLNIII